MDGQTKNVKYCLLTNKNSFLALALITVALQMVFLSAINRKREEEHGPPARYTPEMRQTESDKGDAASFFRYTI